MVVTFGSDAALKKYPDSVALVAALLPDPSLELPHGGSVTRVGLPPAPTVLIAKIKAMDPKLATLAVFNPNGAYSAYMAALKAAAAAAGVGLQTKNAAGVPDLGRQLPGLKGAVQALWVPPDPLFMNRSTFGILTAFCRGGGIAFFAPVVGLAKAGAFAGVAPSFKQVGRAAGLAAAQYNAGSPRATGSIRTRWRPWPTPPSPRPWAWPRPKPTASRRSKAQARPRAVRPRGGARGFAFQAGQMRLGCGPL